MSYKDDTKWFGFLQFLSFLDTQRFLITFFFFPTGSGWNDVIYGTGSADNVCIPCPIGTYGTAAGVGSCDGLLPAGIRHMPQTNWYKSIGDTSELGFLNKNQSCMEGWHCGYGTDRYKCPVSNTV